MRRLRSIRGAWNRLSLAGKLGLPLVAITVTLAVAAGASSLQRVREELSRPHSTVQAHEAAVSRLTRHVVLLASTAVFVEVVALGGLFYALVHRRLRRLTEAAAKVAAGDLSVRVANGYGPPGHDELARLARQFDEMALTVGARTRELQEAEARFRALVEKTPAVVYVNAVDEVSTALYVSPQYERMLGFTPEERLANRQLWVERLHPDDRDRVLAESDRTNRTGEPFRMEYRLVARDGRVVWVRDDALLVRDEGGKPLYWQGVLLDMTERRFAEEALRSSEARKSAVLESALDCVISIDHLGRITEFNPAAERTFGYSRQDVLGRPMAEVIIPPSLRERHRQGFERLMRTGEASVLGRRLELTGMRADGSEFPVEVAITRVDAPGQPSFTGYLRDITERKLAERELTESLELLRQTTRQRQLLLARLQDAQERERQRIAEDIHDDSLQVMTAVGLRLDALTMSAGDPQYRAGLERLADTVRQCIRRLRHLLFELRPTALERHGLAAGLHVYLEELSTETGLEVALDDRLVEEPPDGIRTTLYRIAQEALTNVRKHAEARRVDVRLESREGGVFVRIYDDGRGFGTPGEPISGPGHLGLSAMRERAEMADGWWRMGSRPGEGTTVEFWLPMVSQPAVAEA